MFIKSKNVKKKKPLIIFLMGSTASKKTFLAMKLRKYLPLEIISVDSSLIYKDLNIGTAKPSKKELLKHPHRLINIKEIYENYSVNEFYQDALLEINKVLLLNKIPLLVGGTMFYYKTLLFGLSNLPNIDCSIRKFLVEINRKHGSGFLHTILQILDFERAKLIHPNDFYRILRSLEIIFISKNKFSQLKKKKNLFFSYTILQFATYSKDKNWLFENIYLRLENMINSGFQKEVETLFYKKNAQINFSSMKSIGYKEMWYYILGKISYEEMFTKILINTKNLSKRQNTWLKKWKNLYFLNPKNVNECIEFMVNKITSYLKIKN